MIYNETRLADFLLESELQQPKQKNSWQNSSFFRKITEEFVRELNESGILREGVILESRQLLEEGFWDSVQSGIGNVAGGIDKFLKKIGVKKEPEGYEQAQKIFDNVMSRESNKKVKDLVDGIKDFVASEEKKRGSKEKDQVFPFNKHSDIFIKGCEMLAGAYDTLKSSIEKKEFPAIAGNDMINALRVATEKFLRDAEREKGGVYASFGAGGKSAGEVKVGAGAEQSDAEQSVKESINFLIASRLSNLLFEQNDQQAPAPSKADLSDAEIEKTLGDPKNKEKLEQLTSMKAPKIIAAAGLGSGVLGAFFMSPIFVHFVEFFFKQPEKIMNVGEWQKSAEEYLQQQGIPTNGKLTQTFHHAMKASGIDHPDIGNDPRSTIGDFKKFLADLGGLNGKPGDIEAGKALWASACQDPSAAQKGLDAMLKMGDTANYNKAIGPLTKFSGLPGKPGFFRPVSTVNLLVKGIREVSKYVTKSIVVPGGLTSTGATILTTGTALGPWLAGLGLGAVVAAGTLAYVRKRAKSKSRLGLLTDLKGQMLDVENPGGSVDPPPPGSKTKIVVTLTDDGSAKIKVKKSKEMPSKTKKEDVKEESFIFGKLSDMLFEAANVDVIGSLTIDGKTEDHHSFELVNLSMDKYPPPKVASLDELPGGAAKELKSKIEKVLNGFDLDSPDVSIEIKDMRKKKKKDDGDDGDTEPVKFKKRGPIVATITLFDNDRVKVELRPEDTSTMMTINGKKVSSYDFDIEGTLPKLKVKPRVTNFRSLPREYSDRLEDEIMRILDGFRFNDRTNKIMLQDRRTEKAKETSKKKETASAPQVKSESFSNDNLKVLNESLVDRWKKLAGI